MTRGVVKPGSSKVSNFCDGLIVEKLSKFLMLIGLAFRFYFEVVD